MHREEPPNPAAKVSGLSCLLLPAEPAMQPCQPSAVAEFAVVGELHALTESDK